MLNLYLWINKARRWHFCCSASSWERMDRFSSSFRGTNWRWQGARLCCCHRLRTAKMLINETTWLRPNQIKVIYRKRQKGIISFARPTNWQHIRWLLCFLWQCCHFVPFPDRSEFFCTVIPGKEFYTTPIIFLSHMIHICTSISSE